MRAPEHDPCPVAGGTLPDRTRELLTRFGAGDKGCSFCGSGYAPRLADLLEEWLARDGQRTR
jgi:hypothetical protein